MQRRRLEFTEVHSYSGADSGIGVPTVLRCGRNTVDLVATLDTGASHCLFEQAYALQLELDVASGIRKRFRTANSSFEAFGHEVSVEVFGIVTWSLVYFFGDPSISKNVLGRNGWLDRVRLGVVDHDCMLYLAGYDHEVD